MRGNHRIRPAIEGAIEECHGLQEVLSSLSATVIPLPPPSEEAGVTVVVNLRRCALRPDGILVIVRRILDMLLQTDLASPYTGIGFLFRDDSSIDLYGSRVLQLWVPRRALRSFLDTPNLDLRLAEPIAGVTAYWYASIG